MLFLSVWSFQDRFARSLSGQRALSSLISGFKIEVRAGTVTCCTEPGPSEASWFLAKNAGEGAIVTFDLELLKKTDACVQACISLLLLPDAKASKKTVLKVRCFKDASLKGSKGCLVRESKTKDKSQEGIAQS